MMKSLIIYIYFAAITVGCSDKKEVTPDVMSRNAFVSLLIDMERTEAFTTLLIVENRAGRDEVYQLYKSVFDKHGVDEAMFEQSMLYYASNRQVLHDIYNQVLDSLSVNLPSGVYGEPEDTLSNPKPSTPRKMFEIIQ